MKGKVFYNFRLSLQLGYMILKAESTVWGMWGSTLKGKGGSQVVHVQVSNLKNISFVLQRFEMIRMNSHIRQFFLALNGLKVPVLETQLQYRTILRAILRNEYLANVSTWIKRTPNSEPLAGWQE